MIPAKATVLGPLAIVLALATATASISTSAEAQMMGGRPMGGGMMGGGMMGSGTTGGNTTQNAAPSPTGSDSAGATIYRQDCASCHKADGSGGLNLGTVTSADLRSPGLENLYHQNDKLIARAILDGKDQDGKPLNFTMPHWNGRLTDKQVADVIAYLKTLHKK